jgi:hypothetical protein
MSEQDFLANLYRKLISAIIGMAVTIAVAAGGTLIYIQVEQAKTNQALDYYDRELDKKADRYVLEPRLHNIEILLQELRDDLKDERKLNKQTK